MAEKYKHISRVNLRLSEGRHHRQDYYLGYRGSCRLMASDTALALCSLDSVLKDFKTFEKRARSALLRQSRFPKQPTHLELLKVAEDGSFCFVYQGGWLASVEFNSKQDLDGVFLVGSAMIEI